MQLSIASTIKAMVILLISALVSIMTLKTSFNLARSLCHPSTSQTSRLILLPNTMACLLLIRVDWSRILVSVIASTRVFLFYFYFNVFFNSKALLLFQFSVSLLFQFNESFNSCTLFSFINEVVCNGLSVMIISLKVSSWFDSQYVMFHVCP